MKGNIYTMRGRALPLLVVLLLASPVIAEDWCVQHYNGKWWLGQWWLECHANVSKDGAIVWFDAYVDPNYGVAYQENNFWTTYVLRVAENSPPIAKFSIDPWIPYEPDFYPVSDWTPLEYSGNYIACAFDPTYIRNGWCYGCEYNCTTYKNSMYGSDYTHIDGWCARDDWKGANVTFSGVVETRYIPQDYYEGVSGPRGGYYQARYVFDASGIGTINAGDMFGIRWLLRSSPWVRPGTYVIEDVNRIYYEVVHEPTPECGLTFEMKCNPHSEEGTEHTRGTLMCWVKVLDLNGTGYQEVKVTQSIPDGFVPPSYRDVKVWAYDADDDSRMKMDEYELQISSDQMALTYWELPNGYEGVLVKYPLRYDKHTEPRGYIIVTTIDGILKDGGTCSSTYVTNLLIKD